MKGIIRPALALYLGEGEAPLLPRKDSDALRLDVVPREGWLAPGGVQEQPRPPLRDPRQSERDLALQGEAAGSIIMHASPLHKTEAYSGFRQRSYQH